MEWEECLVSGQVIVVEVEKERKRWHMLKKQQVQLDWCAGLGQLKPWLIGAKLALETGSGMGAAYLPTLNLFTGMDDVIVAQLREVEGGARGVTAREST